MLSRRELFSAGLAGGLTSTTSAAPAEAIEQESTREGQRDLKRIKSLAAGHEARLAKRLGAHKREALLAALRDFT